MEQKTNAKYMPGWQVLRFPNSEFDFNQDNERSEDDENSFYSFSGTDHKESEKDQREWSSPGQQGRKRVNNVTFCNSSVTLQPNGAPKFAVSKHYPPYEKTR